MNTTLGIWHECRKRSGRQEERGKKRTEGWEGKEIKSFFEAVTIWLIG